LAKRLFDEFGANAGIRGVAHITGGGLEENLSRILPKGAAAAIRPDSWPIPSVFGWLQRLGNVDTEEMSRVFNMGIGLVLVVRPDTADAVCNATEGFVIGKIH